MDTALIGLLDTIVKVGLGAIISGITTYIITSRNYEHDEAKTKWEARKSFSGEVIKIAQEYFSAGSRYLAVIDGVSKDFEKNGKAKADCVDFLNGADKEFEEKRFNIELCYGYLLVVAEGESEPSKKLWEYSEVISNLRNEVFFSKTKVFPDQQAVQAYREKLSEIRTSFFISMNTLIKIKAA